MCFCEVVANKCRVGCAVGAAAAAFIAKQLNGSEGLLVSAPLRVEVFALHTAKVGIRPKPLTLFSDWFAM